MVETFDTEEKFYSIEGSWKALEKCASALVFQTYDWCRYAWDCVLSKAPGNRLWVLKWSRDGRDDAVYFPTYIDAKGTLRFILDSDSDACNALYADSGINRYWCYREVADAIMAEPRIRSVWFQKLRCRNETLDYLGVFLPGALIYKDNAYAYMDLLPGGDIVASQGHMKSSDRKHWRQLLRKSEKYEFAVLSANNGDAFPEVDIRRVANEMARRKLRARGFISDDMIAFISKLYEKGSCELPVLMEGGRIVTIEFRLLKDGYTLDWIFLSAKPSTGTEINVRYCTEKAKTDSGVMDFGVGAYEYKILTTRPKVGVTFSLRYSKSKAGFLSDLLALDTRLGKDWVKCWRK